MDEQSIIEQGFNGYLAAEVRDRDGNVVYSRRQKIRSWVGSMAALLWGMFYNNTFALITTSNGTAVVNNTTPISSLLPVNASAGTDSYGILIGSGTNPVSPDNYNLQSKIPNSAMSYGAVSISSLSSTGSGYQFTISRTFTNSSSSAITVSEVGVATAAKVLILRDLLSPAASVPSGGTLTITYTLVFPV